MGMEFLVSLAVYAVSAVLSYFFYKPKISGSKAKASGLDDFSITKASEGTPIPVVFGKVKITGNIVWYGNLQTIEQKSDAGGKGGGGGSTTTGYHYYLDCWQTLCLGPIKVKGVYKENKQFITSELAPSWSAYMEDSDDGIASQMTINYGNGTSNFTIDSITDFTPVSKVGSVYMNDIFCGAGTNFPSFAFVVECNYSFPWSNPSNGTNPANAIWFMLTTAGESGTTIDTTSFAAAASYYNSKGYGINMAVGSQGNLGDKLEQILAPVGGYYFENGGKHYLFPADPFAAAADSIVDDFLSFTMSRKSWDDTFNEIKATFTQESKDFTERSSVVRNTASINMLGQVRTKTYDLTVFRDLETTQRRITELIKSESYPYSEIEFSTDWTYSNLIEGNIINITNSEMGIYNVSYRITEKNIENIQNGEVSFHVIQIPETMFDEHWEDIGTGVDTWVREVKKPVALTKTRIFEMPRTAATDKPTVAILCAKELGQENGYTVYYSGDNSNYQKADSGYIFSQYFTVKTAYTSSTYDIDDSVGIYLTPFKSTYTVESLSRSGLFSTNRFLVVDNEIMKFQTATIQGDGSFLLTGVMRGVFNTTKASHSAGAGAWIVDGIGCLYTPINGIISGYYKIVPRTLAGTLTISAVSAINFSGTTYGEKPFGVARVYASRSGSTVNVTVSVKDMTNMGAGVGASTLFTTTSDSDVIIEWKLSTDSTYTVLGAQVGTFTVTNASAFTLNVRSKEFGIYTSVTSLTVGSSDGTYTV